MKCILSSLLVITLALSAQAVITLNSCEICQEFTQIAEVYVKHEGWNATELLANLDRVCDYLGSEAGSCKAVMCLVGTPYFECIVADGQNTTVCCDDIPYNFCPKASVEEVLIDVLVVAEDEVDANNRTVCQICADFGEVIEVLVKYEGWTAEQIVAEADKVCESLGSDVDECKALVLLFGKRLATCIADGDNTTTCCADIRVCPDNDAIAIDVVSPTECQYCRDFAEIAGLLVHHEGWNAADVMAHVDLICGFTGSYDGTCKALIQQLGMPLAECITASPINATQCCEEIPDYTPCPGAAMETVELDLALINKVPFE